MKIDKSKYQGYIWYSNQQEPELLYNEEFELEISDTTNPFLIEGQLFDGEKSISIKYIDGKYIIKEFNLSEYSNVEKKTQQYLPNRMDLKGKLLTFNQYWRPQVDKLCENMPVLKPAELVFVGFKNKEE